MNPSGCKTLSASLLSAFLSLALTATAAHAVTIDWVTVGDPGNANDTTGYGAVADSYRIGKYEVTIGQYTDFLNAVAATDPYSLYNESMATALNIAGISRTGASGSYTYSVIGPSGSTPAGASSPGNRPITYVSWFDAARFANWMHNGQLTGAAGAASTETGAYTLGGATSGNAVAKNAATQFYIPTEDQWYKAAYYKGSGTNAGYWTYATRSDTVPGNVIGSLPNQVNYTYFDGTDVFPSVTQVANFETNQNYLTDVGAFTNSASAYGTFDQSGNVNEWNDLGGSTGSSRGVRGGSFSEYFGFVVSSSNRGSVDPTDEIAVTGFRLASPASGPSGVPEIDPAGLGSVLALVTGALGLFERRRMKAKVA